MSFVSFTLRYLLHFQLRNGSFRNILIANKQEVNYVNKFCELIRRVMFISKFKLIKEHFQSYEKLSSNYVCFLKFREFFFIIYFPNCGENLNIY